MRMSTAARWRDGGTFRARQRPMSSAHPTETGLAAIGAAIRNPQRLLLFALAALIHFGLYQLLATQRHARVELPERRTTLVFLRDAVKSQHAPVEVTPLAPKRRAETSPSEDPAPQLIAPPASDEARAPPLVDWRRDAEEIAREHALAAEAQRPQADQSGPATPKPEFGWSRSRTRRIEPMDGG